MLSRIAYAFFIIGLFCGLYSQTVDIPFDQLDEIIIQTSPDNKVFQAEQEMFVAESKAELQWSNPELELEREELTNNFYSEYEFIVGIGKNITMPWVGSAHKSMWKSRIIANDYFQKSHLLELLATTRLQYVEIQLLSEKRDRLAGIQSLIQQASQISDDRLEQGSISGMQNKLLQISLFNLNSGLLEIKRHITFLNSDLKLGIGFTQDQDILLSSQINFKPVDLQIIREESSIGSNPVVIASTHLIEASQKLVKMEQGKLLPEMGIRSGYKQASDNLNGYVVGLSLPLPFFNQNRAKVQQQQLQANILEIQTSRLKTELQNKVTNNLSSLNDLFVLLSDSQTDFKKQDEIIEDLVFSFKEGWIELGDVLEGIRIYSESLNSYYENLALYYKTAFQLEKLTGKKLVSF